MKRILSLAALVGIVLTSCQHPHSKQVEKIDTVVIVYRDNIVGWRLNTAIRKQYMGRKFVADSGLDAKEAYISVFRLQLPALKVDSIVDSTSHKLLRINPRYQEQWLPDSLSHYITLLDSTKQ